jgi:hypothetical protein
VSNVDPGGVPTAPDVFLSYAREDRALADDLVRRLRGDPLDAEAPINLQC